MATALCVGSYLTAWWYGPKVVMTSRHFPPLRPALLRVGSLEPIPLSVWVFGDHNAVWREMERGLNAASNLKNHKLAHLWALPGVPWAVVPAERLLAALRAMGR